MQPLECMNRICSFQSIRYVRTQDKETPLHFAASRKISLVDALLNHPPPPDVAYRVWIDQMVGARNKDGLTPVDVARKRGFNAIARAMEQKLREAVLLEDGTDAIRECKLLVCGFEKVGKTTLVHNALAVTPPAPTDPAEGSACHAPAAERRAESSESTGTAASTVCTPSCMSVALWSRADGGI
eukprot:m.988639 g.988639  ORF g.988639 m.988639 type:complete len:184 (-) comp23993_c1_seq26:2203-2754(-)